MPPRLHLPPCDISILIVDLTGERHFYDPFAQDQFRRSSSELKALCQHEELRCFKSSRFIWRGARNSLRGASTMGMRSSRQSKPRVTWTLRNGQSLRHVVALGVSGQKKASAAACFSIVRGAQAARRGSFTMMGKTEGPKRREFTWRPIVSPKANMSLCETRQGASTPSKSSWYDLL